MYKMDEKIIREIKREGGLEGCIVNFIKRIFFGFLLVGVILGAINLIIYWLK